MKKRIDSKPARSLSKDTKTGKLETERTQDEASRKRSILTSVLFFGVLGCFLAGTLLFGNTDLSYSERRKLAPFPKLEAKAILSGQWQEEFEDFATDHVGFREQLLKIKSLSSRYVFGNLDDDGITSHDKHLIQVEREIHEDSLDYAAGIFADIVQKDLAGTSCKVYLSIIPDKSYFLKKDEYLNMDYEAFFEQVKEKMEFGNWIDLRNTLQLDDYYYTDPHWRQEKILDAATRLADSMGVRLLDAYTVKTALNDFIGQTGGRTMLPSGSDTLRCLWNEEMKDWTVRRYDTGKPEVSAIYDLDKAQGMDPYQIFLGGSSGMIEIDNPHADPNRQLIVFSDSYGSSMVPLLAGGYSKTTLIDLRNLPHWRLKSLIDFKDQDVLFLYSTSVLNASQSMK